MYTHYSPSEQAQLDGLFSVLGKIGKGVLKSAKNYGQMQGQLMAQQWQTTQTGSSPYTGTGGAAMSPQDRALLRDVRAAQMQDDDMPEWVLPVAIAGGAAVLGLILMRK